MSTPNQLDGWLKEIEIRPESAAEIIRAIASRLAELDAWNDELLADNIELRSGHRVEEYLQRISSLENQLELIKRQVGSGSASALPFREDECLLLFHPKGWLLRLNFQRSQKISGAEVAHFQQSLEGSEITPGILTVVPQDELLLVFDSGRAVKQSVDAIPASGAELNWQNGLRVQPRPGEELVAVLPISDLTYNDYCVQVSRKACAKLIPKSSFQSSIAKGAIGAGIKKRPDRTAGLAYANRDDHLVLASLEGAVLAIPTSLLPYSVDEVIQLAASDYIVSIFNPRPKTSLLFFTNVGKVILRDAGWLEPAASFKSRGQPLFSAVRRESGVRVVGAVALSEMDWCSVLTVSGQVLSFRASDLMARGAVGDGAPASQLVGIAASLPVK